MSEKDNSSSEEKSKDTSATSSPAENAGDQPKVPVSHIVASVHSPAIPIFADDAKPEEKKPEENPEGDKQ